MKLLEKLKTGRLFFDGSMGTMLQSMGLPAGEPPEIWNISHPERIRGLFEMYLKAGCEILTTNTFGANRLKFPGKDGAPSLEEIVSSAIGHAKSAISECAAPGRERYVALDIGPTGKLLKPFGDLDFEDAVEIFAEVVRLGVRYGADLVLIETMGDSYETKAAVLAAKENSALPVFATNTYDGSGKLTTGATPSAMVAMLEGLRVDALGINCGIGPDMALPIVKELVRCASVPVIARPNAGLPVIREGKTVFDLRPEAFAGDMAAIAETGACVLGGCCGTTPQHIREMIEAVRKIPYIPPEKKSFTVVSSYTHSLFIGERPVLIGERINPTGKANFKRALREQDMDYILREGVSQQEIGADILDVNVGLPEIDEKAMLTRTLTELQAVSDLPLQIDTSDPAAMEAALRLYNGKALINSVNGKAESMSAIFPLAAKYGGVLVALTLDESGIPADADGRIAIAEKILHTAKSYGIDAKDIVVDPLTMAASTDSRAALVTVECVRDLHARGIRTSLGVSNISFGLPQRGLVNTAFFAMALTGGLDMAIMNPRAKEMMDIYYAFCVLLDRDPQCQRYIAYAAQQPKADAPAAAADAQEDAGVLLKRAIVRGLKENAAALAGRLAEQGDMMDVINRCIIPALDEVGAAFEQKKAFLPQLLLCAEAAKAAFEVLRAKLISRGEVRAKKGKIVLATVKGDVHDIGKNIVKSLLENYDYEVFDLGRDVPPEKVVETVLRERAPLVGLSALMTTTVPAMRETIALLRRSAPGCRVVVGGAVLTQEYADMIGADKYAKDAMETVRYAEMLMPSRKT